MKNGLVKIVITWDQITLNKKSRDLKMVSALYYFLQTNKNMMNLRNRFVIYSYLTYHYSV